VREVAEELFSAGYSNSKGNVYTPQSIATMLED
jgi:hypothetical protein